MEKGKLRGERCSNCDSTFTYLRIKTGQRVCRNCGFIDNIKIKEVKNDEHNFYKKR